MATAALLVAPGVTSCKKSGSKAPGSGTPITIVQRAPFREGLEVLADIRNDCDLEGEIPRAIHEEAQKDFAITWAPTPESAQGTVLSVTITELSNFTGGAYTGPKFIAVEGSLSQNGQVIGTFKGRRTTTGGMFAGYKTTCAMFDTCVEEIGEDITEWLYKPQMDARLGEL